MSAEYFSVHARIIWRNEVINNTETKLTRTEPHEHA